MLRSLLSLLALLVPGLAFLFNRPWLNVLTVVIVLGCLGLLGWWLWTQYGADEPERPRPRPAPEDSDASFEELGIVDIQPQGASRQPSETDAAAASDSSSAASSPSNSTETPATAPPPSTPSSEGTESARAAGTTERSETPHEEAPTLGPLLESLRSALDAQTVCLLVQEEVALTYRIEALASTQASVRHEGTFDTQTPLLTATMSRASVTVRSLSTEEVAVEDLGYYTSPPEVDHLAVAPIPRPDESSTTFLLADAPSGTDLGTARARTLLEHFVDTVDLFLSDDSAAPDPATSTTNADENERADSDAHETESETENPEDPRPRRELIAEEMEAAQTAEEALALALVHLNRAESIARRGEEAVTSAEHLLQARLEQLIPGRRIERFGELTYGIFFREGADAVEPEVARLESMMVQEEGELEGGVSVGVAVWNAPDETPEALRAAATEALREAYETGTPTIVT